MKRGSITQRWFINSLGIVLLIFIIIEIVFTFSMRDYYYSYSKDYMTSRMKLLTSTLLKVSQNNKLNYSSEIRNTVENFDEKDKIELMAINTKGNVVVTSSGFPAPEDINMNDYLQAQQLSSGISYTVYKLENGEKVMSVCSLVPAVATTQFTALKMVTSLERVDSQITYLVTVMTIIFSGIIVIISLSGLYFVKSIVIPVREIGIKARHFATGDFSGRIEKKNDDEIGQLCDIINGMADELSNAEAMKNEFISSVSHELRTPLTAIKGWSETLNEIDDPETIRKGLNVITNETERLSQMVEELLDFSRIQNGRFILSKEPTDILAELGEAVLMYRVKVENEGKTLSYNEPEMLSFVYGDRNRLRQVFINIIDNALKYTDEGDAIDVSVYEKDEFIHIIIADSGCGISKTDLPKIKTKFYKANHTRRGSGVGLAVADEIIAMHGGKINISSEENIGTTVEILLPVAPKEMFSKKESQQETSVDLHKERNLNDEE